MSEIIKCNYCNKKFKNIQDLLDHECRKRHTEMCLRFGISVGCPICDKPSEGILI